MLHRLSGRQFDDGLLLFHNQTNEPILDTYCRPVPVGGSRKRLKPCRYEVPCLGFRCWDEKHTGATRVPWCLGAAPEYECNVCWVKSGVEL